MSHGQDSGHIGKGVENVVQTPLLSYNFEWLPDNRGEGKQFGVQLYLAGHAMAVLVPLPNRGRHCPSSQQNNPTLYGFSFMHPQILSRETYILML